MTDDNKRKRIIVMNGYKAIQNKDSDEVWRTTSLTKTNIPPGVYKIEKAQEPQKKGVLEYQGFVLYVTKDEIFQLVGKKIYRHFDKNVLSKILPELMRGRNKDYFAVIDYGSKNSSRILAAKIG